MKNLDLKWVAHCCVCELEKEKERELSEIEDHEYKIPQNWEDWLYKARRHERKEREKEAAWHEWNEWLRYQH